MAWRSFNAIFCVSLRYVQELGTPYVISPHLRATSSPLELNDMPESTKRSQVPSPLIDGCNDDDDDDDDDDDNGDYIQ